MKFRVWYPRENKLYYTTIEYSYTTLGKDAWCEPYTIQLFSGGKDKNGKEIYSGDILNYQGRKGTVIFFACSFRVDWGDQTDDDLGYLQTGDIEVVGNIFGV